MSSSACFTVLIFQPQINPPLPVGLRQSAKQPLCVEGGGKGYEASGGKNCPGTH